MKKIILLLIFGVSTNLSAECNGYNQSQCNNDDSCEWIEDIANMSCSGFTIEACNMQDECFLEQDCTQWGSWYSWICYDYGPLYCSGSYDVDNSYCQEIEMPECSEMNEIECSSDDGCEWTENIEIESCNDINSQQECNAVGCSWYNGNYYACSICCWGEYEVDNSFCEEPEYQLGDINNDLEINILDIIAMIDLILTNSYDSLADINNDNTINITDVIILINIILDDI